MSSAWYVKEDSKVYGPFTPIQMKQMVAQGRIKEDSPVARDKSGPFVRASKYKGLIEPRVLLAKSVETDDPAVDEDYVELAPPFDTHNAHPLMALWSMAISSGLIVASLLYAIAWKFASPVWTYGTALVPVSVMLLIISFYAYKASRMKLNRNSLTVNAAFTVLTFISSIGSIYNMWTADFKMNDAIKRVK